MCEQSIAGWGGGPMVFRGKTALRACAGFSQEALTTRAKLKWKRIFQTLRRMISQAFETLEREGTGS